MFSLVITKRGRIAARSFKTQRGARMAARHAMHAGPLCNVAAGSMRIAETPAPAPAPVRPEPLSLELFPA